MTEAITASSDSQAPGGHGHEDHPPFLAHHFDTPQQQFDTGKLGTWLFLVTEILFFSGLFLFYAVYRSNHPEVFVDAHKYLDKSLGAFNTIVLLFSSLTMAWGVRCAQLGHRKGLVTCLAITLACASLFLGIKAVEYTHKWDLGLYWGAAFSPTAHAEHHGISRSLLYLCLPATLLLVWQGISVVVAKARGDSVRQVVSLCLVLTAAAFFVGVGCGFAIPAVQAAILPGAGEHQAESHATAGGHEEAVATGGEATGDEATGGEAMGGEATGDVAAGDAGETVGVTESVQVDEGAGASQEDTVAEVETVDEDPMAAETETDMATASTAGQPSLTAVFFSIYYAITGLHAVHIIAGMLVLTWLLGRAVKGHFNEDYFGPVDYVGLYWHLVDLIWIYLFPLLYLIH